MLDAIRMIQVEDSEADAALVAHILEKSGFRLHRRVVDSEEHLDEALRDSPWDLVIADFHLPQFSAPEALKSVQRAIPDIPFIVVSGVMGEEAAVAMIKAGAHDYLLKDRLERLPAAVERALDEAAMRRQKQEAEQKLRQAHAELETIYKNTPALMLVTDRLLRVTKINERLAQFCRKRAEEVIGEPICGVLQCPHPQPESIDAIPDAHCSQCPIWTAFANAFQKGITGDSFEIWSPIHGAQEGDGHCLLISLGLMGEGGSCEALFIAQDATRLKRAERTLQNTVQSLQAALAQNSVLFQEVHHRVKNNLQIIASLLSMKARKCDQAVSVEDLKDCERRVKTMAMIHEQLYSRRDFQNIDFEALVRRTAPELVASFDREDAIQLRMELRPVVLTLDQSIPCGLILTEAITNAIKYAYPDRKGELVIELDCVNGEVRLRVADRGVGLPDVSMLRSDSLGMTLIQMLTKQLHGSVEYFRKAGTAVELRFRNMFAGEADVVGPLASSPAPSSPPKAVMALPKQDATQPVFPIQNSPSST